MRLVDAKVGEVVRVVGFRGRKLDSKLLQVGLYPGDRMRLLRLAPLGGPLLVDVGGREMALGRGVARRILVEVE
jgi:ferrous iron transport protein A